MPTYDYKCDACGTGFERFQSITAPAIRKCPKCGKLKVRRLIGPGAGLIFKGSGFYITDYRSEGYKNAAKGESPGGDGKAEAQPADTGSKSDPRPAADTKSTAETKPKSDEKPKHKRESKKS